MNGAFFVFRVNPLGNTGLLEKITSEWMDLIALRLEKKWPLNSMTQKITSK